MQARLRITDGTPNEDLYARWGVLGIAGRRPPIAHRRCARLVRIRTPAAAGVKRARHDGRDCNRRNARMTVLSMAP